MKFILYILLFLAGFAGTAQEIETKLENFTSVEITSGLTVEFEEAPENKVIVTGPSSDKVKINVEKGKLLISSDLTKIVDTDSTIVKVNYRQIQELETRENSQIEFLNKINQRRIILKARSGSSINAHLKVRDLLANAFTGGKLDLTGTARYQEIEVMSEGDFRGENLKGDTIKVTLTGGGIANVFSNNYVNALVRAGGHIYIYGEPKKIDERTSYGGSIKKIN